MTGQLPLSGAPCTQALPAINVQRPVTLQDTACPQSYAENASPTDIALNSTETETTNGKEAEAEIDKTEVGKEVSAV